MRTLRTYLRPTLALLLALASIPAWACARPCDGKGEASLACVRLCAHSQALLTQGGKLASVGSQTCGVELRTSQDNGVVAPTVELQAPAEQGGILIELPALGAPQAAPLAAATRGPPQPSLYLAFQHPTQTGPPSFV